MASDNEKLDPQPYLGDDFSDEIQRWYRALVYERSRLTILIVDYAANPVTYTDLAELITSIEHQQPYSQLPYKPSQAVRGTLVQTHLPRLKRTSILQFERPTADDLKPGTNFQRAVTQLETAPLTPTPADYHRAQIREWYEGEPREGLK